MTAFTDLLREILTEGTAHLRRPPVVEPGEHTAALQLLEHEFLHRRLEIAGPRIPFAPEMALAAAVYATTACWFLVHRQESPAQVERALAFPQRAATPSDHLSADLLLQYLPGVHRRARAIDPRDTLTLRLEEVLRHWPLSGVLSDIVEPPLESLSFGSHPGLLLLYAERLTGHPRPAWVGEGLTRDHAERAFGEKGMALP